MEQLLEQLTGVKPVTEHRFHPVRRWRLDYAWPKIQVAIEIQGGVWTRGRHSRGKGQEADYEKHASATMMGWTVFFLTPGMVNDGRANAIFDWIRQAAKEGLCAKKS